MIHIKHLLLILIVPFVIMNSSINVFADSDAYKKHKNLYDDSCIPIMEKLKNSFYEDEGVVVDENKSEYNLISVHKRYLVLGEIAKSYKSCKNFNEIIGDEFDYWVFTSKDGDAVLKATGDFYTVGRFHNPEKNHTVNFSIVEKAIESLGGNFENENLIVKCASFFPYYGLGEVVYINLSGKEYFIHFSNNPKLSGFENGKLYKIDKLIEYIDKIEKRVAKQQAIEDGTYKDKTDYLPYIIIGGCVLIITSTTVILLLIRKNKKSANIEA